MAVVQAARLLLLAGCLGVGLGACTRKAPEAEPVRAVKLLQVGGSTAPAAREYAGDVRAHTEVRLGFQVGGKLVQRPVELGQVVRPGQLLAQMDAQDYALGAQAAQAQLQAALTQRNLAQADWERFSALEQQGFISPVELDRRRASLDAAQAQWQQAQAQAQVQGNQSRYTRLLADAPGVITAVHAEPGQVLAVGTPVVSLALDGPRDAVFALPEDQRGQITVGQTVQVKLWGNEQVLPATVRELAASADPATRTFVVKAALQVGDDASAMPALGSTVRVLVPPPASAAQAAANTLELPSSAVWQQAGGATAVWVLDAATSTVHAQPVVIAGVNGNALVVQSGLEPGQQVVATGTHVLTEGQKVHIYAGSGAQP